MKFSTISCDQVFDVLTRGPFPSGQPSDAGLERSVEMHLVGCHECRQVAEALRPAVSLFHESMANGGRLPQYEGRLAPAELVGLPALISQVIDECESEPARSEKPMSAAGPRVPVHRADSQINARRSAQAPVPRPVWPMAVVAATLLVGLTVGAWRHGSNFYSSADATPASPVVTANAGPLFWANLGLSPSCLTELASTGADGRQHVEPPSEMEASSLLCCTRCHTASQPGLIEREKLALVQESCGTCHVQ